MYSDAVDPARFPTPGASSKWAASLLLNFRAPNRSSILPRMVGDLDMVAWLHLFVLSPVGVDIDFASTGNQLHPDEPLLISQRARVLARAAKVLVHQIPI